jgi:hypothetical protein
MSKFSSIFLIHFKDLSLYKGFSISSLILTEIYGFIVLFVEPVHAAIDFC